MKKSQKKTALRRLLILWVVLILFILLSGTFQSMNTAKIIAVTPQYGYLTDSIPVSGILSFSESEEIWIPDIPESLSVTIKEVHVIPGMKVQQGDPLFDVSLSNLTSRTKELQSQYHDLAEELAGLELDNQNLRITSREEAWLNAYLQYIDQQQILLDIKSQGSKYHAIEIELEEQKLSEYFDALIMADRFITSPSIKEYLLSKNSLVRKMKAIESSMKEIIRFSESVSLITSPHSGYIISVNIQSDSIYNGKMPALTMSAAGSTPEIIVNIDHLRRNITEGFPIQIFGNVNAISVISAVQRVFYDQQGNTCAAAPIQESDLQSLGGINSIVRNGLSAAINYTAVSPSLLVPAGAVRGNNPYYVFEIIESENALGKKVLKVHKSPVTLLDLAENTASLSDDINTDIRIAYLENRPIHDGMEVILQTERN